MNPANRKATIVGAAAERLVPEFERKEELVREHMARYEYAMQFVSEKSVLDIACGAGYGSAILKRGGATHVVGVDLSEKAILYARDHYLEEGVEFLRSNAEQIELAETFDVIVSFETIEHLPNPERFLAETHRLLKPNGTLIISTTVRSRGTLHTKPLNPHHLREWSVQEFKELLGRFYNIVRIEGQYTFRKRWFPYSRRLERLFFKARYPEHLSEIDKLSVRSGSPMHKGFAFAMSYVVAVCSNELFDSSRAFPIKPHAQ